MSLNLISDIRRAYSNLNPGAVQEMAEKIISIGILTENESTYRLIQSYFDAPGTAIERISGSASGQSFDLLIAEPNFPSPKTAIIFRPGSLSGMVEEIVDAHPELEVALARNIVHFREPVIRRIIHRTAKENALFSIVTALPNVVPNLLELPWAVGEFATDTAFLTINQIRMAFLIAACHEKQVGYVEQKMELGTIVAGAFGWRALARELVGKIPLGGGLIPKAAISFAGTYLIGAGLDRLHRTGAPLSKYEKNDVYGAALEKGKAVVGQLVAAVKNRNAA